MGTATIMGLTETFYLNAATPPHDPPITARMRYLPRWERERTLPVMR